MKIVRKTYAFLSALVIFAAVMAFVSCKKEKTVELAPVSGDTMHLEPYDSPDTPAQAPVPHWYKEDGVVCLVFAYGFNSNAFCEDTLASLSKVYGLDTDGGIIHPLVFPDDFKDRISALKTMTADLNLRGIIILGAPEGTHNALSSIRQEWEEEPPFAIFSLFPQDNILGQEASCDFVLEYERSAAEDAGTEEIAQNIEDGVSSLLLRAVRYMMELDGPLTSDENLHQHVQNIAGSHKVHRYVDRETGIQSINHFVMEAK